MDLMSLLAIILCVNAPSVAFGFLFFMHARGERKALLELAREAFLQLNSKDSIVASQAKANDAYQEEAMRQHAIAFDKQPKAPKAEPDDGPPIIRDQHGATYEVLAGMG